MVDVVQPLVCSDPPQAACGGVLRSKWAKQSRLHVLHMVRCAVLAQVRVVVACALVHCFRHTSLAPSTCLSCQPTPPGCYAIAMLDGPHATG